MCPLISLHQFSQLRTGGLWPLRAPVMLTVYPFSLGQKERRGRMKENVRSSDKAWGLHHYVTFGNTASTPKVQIFLHKTSAHYNASEVWYRLPFIILFFTQSCPSGFACWRPLSVPISSLDAFFFHPALQFTFKAAGLHARSRFVFFKQLRWTVLMLDLAGAAVPQRLSDSHPNQTDCCEHKFPWKISEMCQMHF